MKRVENRFDEATQKFRQLDGVKLHLPIPPPQAEPLPASNVRSAIDSNVCGEEFVLYQTIVMRLPKCLSVAYRKEAIAAARSS